MPTAIVEVPAAEIPQFPRRKVWTREEVAALEATGVLAGQKLELIEGELIDKMGKNQPHVLAVRLLVNWLTEAFGALFVLHEAPMEVALNERRLNQPEPDAIVLDRNITHFAKSAPEPQDIRLAVEVADSTVSFDLKVKAALYARAGIREYWVLDVSARRMIVHREPVDGRYAQVAAYAENETVAALAAPDRGVRVGEFFVGPAA